MTSECWSSTEGSAQCAPTGRNRSTSKIPFGSSNTLPSLPDHRVYSFVAMAATIHGVKAYRIERIKGGMKFSCKQCAHSVTTLEFDAKVGNLRTQAATAINAHATTAHQAPMVVSAPDSQQRSWR